MPSFPRGCSLGIFDMVGGLWLVSFRNAGFPKEF